LVFVVKLTAVLSARCHDKSPKPSGLSGSLDWERRIPKVRKKPINETTRIALV
jgi:hypothetical protein